MKNTQKMRKIPKKKLPLPDQRYKLLNITLLLLFNYLYHLFFTKTWPYLKKTYPSKKELTKIITIPILILAFIIPYAFYTFLYIKKIPFFENFKVNSEKWPWEKNKKLFKKKLKKTIALITLNILIGLITTTILNHLTKISISKMPTFQIHLTNYFLCGITTSFFFYWSHRFLHLPFIYKKIHKIHHEHSNTIVFAATYAHPIELIFGNIMPKYMICFILGRYLHISTFYCYFFTSVVRTNEEHSGYEFPVSFTNWNPFDGDSSFHNFHHFKNVGNYGAYLIIWDRIFRTDCYYREYLQGLKEKGKVR